MPKVSEEASPGEKLHYYRELRQMTIQEIASALDITRNGVLNYEKGFNPIYYPEAVRIAQILRVEPEALLDDYTTFCRPGYGKRIRAIRRLYNLSQARFAKMNGWSRTTVSVWEAEIRNHHPSREAYHHLLRLAEAKGVNIHDA
jgi:transcriptional regulator with XRE-family HTH domain